jgi:hypothetical protein
MCLHCIGDGTVPIEEGILSINGHQTISGSNVIALPHEKITPRTQPPRDAFLEKEYPPIGSVKDGNGTIMFGLPRGSRFYF